MEILELIFDVILIGFTLAMVYLMASNLVENRQADKRLQKGDEWLDKK